MAGLEQLRAIFDQGGIGLVFIGRQHIRNLEDFLKIKIVNGVFCPSPRKLYQCKDLLLFTG